MNNRGKNAAAARILDYLGATILVYLIVLTMITVPYVLQQRRSLLPLAS